MFRTPPRRTHRAPGRAVIDYRGLAAPVGRSMGGVAALGAVTAGAAISGTSAAPAHAAAPTTRPSSVTSPLPTLTIAAPAPALRPALPTSVSLRAGARGDAVRALQQALNDQGADIEVDGIFGSRTDRAVRSLQRANGLAVDGIVGPRTWSALGGSAAAPALPAAPAPTRSEAPAAPTTTPTLRRGQSGNSVRTLQQMLRDRGATFPATGYFGSQTQAAVRSFQSSHGLVADGIVGARTWAALQSSDDSLPTAPPVATTGGGNVGGSVGSTAGSGTGSETSAGGSSGGASSASSFSGDSIVALARAQVGTTYVFGASSPSTGFDCSGLVKYVYNQHGISVPRTARQQVYGGRIISRAEAQPGDLVAFTAGNYGHIGIYAGDGMIVDASGSGRVVKHRPIWNAPHVFVTYR